MTNNRPLSPHLSIHKKVLTAFFSIFHRFTGIVLSLGTIFIAIWISLIALGPNYFYLYEKIAVKTFLCIERCGDKGLLLVILKQNIILIYVLTIFFLQNFKKNN